MHTLRLFIAAGLHTPQAASIAELASFITSHQKDYQSLSESPLEG